MAVVAITGGPGAPGATSAALALLLSWPLTERRRVLLIEADPDGGAVLAGALQGEVRASKGLRHLALSDRRGRLLEEMWDQCIDLSAQGTGDRLLLPGLTDPAQAPALVYTWEPLAEACQALDGYGCDVIIDLGRSGGQGPSAVLARRADAVLAVLRTTLRGLSTARPRVAALAAELTAAGAGDALALLLVREGPYAAAEVSRTLGAPVVGLLPFAPREARILSDGGGRTSDRRFQRSELMRAARSTGDELRALTARRRLVARPQQPAAEVQSQPEPGAISRSHPTPLHAVPAPSTRPSTPTASPPPSPDAARLGYREAARTAPAADPAPATWAAPGTDRATASWPHPMAPTPPAPDPAAPGHPWPSRDPWPAAAAEAPSGVRPWSAHEAVATGQPDAFGARPGVPAAAGVESRVGGPGREGRTQVSGDGVSAARPWSVGPGEDGPYPRSVREVLDLAATAELGAEPVAPPGPVASPIGPVTPGQAARLQAVHTHTAPQAAATAAEEAGNPFNPPHMVAMPPLAEHAPRPPAPEEIRPADGGHGGADGAAGEVTRVR